MSQVKRLFDAKNEEKLEFKTKNQELLFDTLGKCPITFCTGPAGTGKTFITLYYALSTLADKNSGIDNIVICRPLVPVDDEEIGFLKGNLNEKIGPYMLPFFQNLEKIIGKDRASVLLQTEIIKAIPLTFFRGLTFDNAVIIYDEAQNSSIACMKSFLTRIGHRSKMAVLGDIRQSDREHNNGLADATVRLSSLEEVGLVEFTREDIVRNGIISKILEKYEGGSHRVAV